MSETIQRVTYGLLAALALTACATATGDSNESDTSRAGDLDPFRDTGRTSDTTTGTDGGSDCEGPDCACLPAPELCNGADEDCDLEIDEDFNFMSDVTNCGGCSLTCAPANAAGLCVEGICTIGSCNAGFGNCDRNDSNGCETNIASATGCADCAAVGGINGEPCGTCGAGVWACQSDGSTVCEGEASGSEVNACGGCGVLEGVPGDRCGTCDTGAWACETQTSVTCIGDQGDLALNACGECIDADACEPGDVESRPSVCPGGTNESRTCSEGCRWSEWACGAPTELCTPSAVEEEERDCGSCGEGVQSRTRACAADGSDWLPWTEWGVCRTGANCEPGESDSQTQSCGLCPGGTQSRDRICDAATCTWADWSPYGACEGGGGECSPGDTDNQTRACTCGGNESRSRTCQDSCTWGGWTGWSGCSRGTCTPGDTRAGSCDGCSHQVCNDSCNWGSCQLRAGNSCDWEAGTNWRCCATSRWQFCLSSCQWSTDCVACTGCGCR